MNSSPIPNQPFSSLVEGALPALSTAQIDMDGVASVTETLSKEDTNELRKDWATKAYQIKINVDVYGTWVPLNPEQKK